MTCHFWSLQLALSDQKWQAAMVRALLDIVHRVSGVKGCVLSDACREVSLTPGDRPQTEWVTRLVQPIATPA